MKKFLTLLLLFIASIGSALQPTYPLGWTDKNPDGSPGLFIALLTPRLFIRSILPQDLDAYCELFANPIAMEKYATGVVKTYGETKTRFENSWLDRWQKGDPFSAMAVTLVTDDSNPLNYPVIGHIAMGYGDDPGQSELAYLFFPEYWNKGYGKESILALVNTLAPHLQQLGYQLDGAPFKEIVATSRVDNDASNKILLALGMHELGMSQKYGFDRIHFSIQVSELK